MYIKISMIFYSYNKNYKYFIGKSRKRINIFIKMLNII